MFFRQTKSHNKLTSADKQILQQTTVDMNTPGSILHDFEAVLDFVVTKRPSLTKNHQLPMKALAPLNERLQQPIQHGLKRPQQKSLPPVNGLYLLLRASGITTVNTTAKTPKLIVDDSVLSSWQTLNPTEKYFMLLESWLFRGSMKILGDLRGLDSPLDRCLQFISRLPPKGINAVQDIYHIENLRYWPELHNLALMALFGFVDIAHGQPVAGEGWQIQSVQTTPLGRAVFKVLTDIYADDELFYKLGRPSAILPGALRPLFQPYFPEWQNNLSWPAHTFRDGRYIFKVTLSKDVWWRIAIPAQSFLEELCLAILNAASFDNDHLHRFIYTSRIGLQEEVQHPRMDEGPYTDEVRVGDVPLAIGGSMLFNFDFGDDWYFNLTLEQIEHLDAKLKNPKLLESHGEAPPQYPDYDDEW